ncbi:MAG: hypothetical protein KBT47_05900, partial [Armatimonadetes bacterium]|nr:hypothetical protein [Candidatus Hippobium faecium]
EQPLLGADFAAQARVCAKNGAGMRLTNEVNKFYDNFAVTCHPWSACNYYGADFALEPVGPITPRGFRERLFGTMAYGNVQFHTYTPFDENNNMKYEDKDWDFFNENMKPFKPGKTIGVFYPMYQSIFTGEVSESVNEAVKLLRHNFPISVICETMILDGALDNLDTLVIMDAEWTDREIIDKIVAWAKTRGKQLVANCILKDINLNEVPEFNALFGINENSELCHGHQAHKFVKTPGFDFLNEIDVMDACDCYKDLDSDVEIMAYAAGHKDETGESAFCLDECPDVYSVFKKKINDCNCIMYTGYCDLIYDPESLFCSNQAFAALLKDVAKQDGVSYFELKEGEVAKAEFFGKTLTLTEKEIRIDD